MKSRFWISYTIDAQENMIGYESSDHRDAAYRLFTETGILRIEHDIIRPDIVCAMDVLACAAFQQTSEVH